MLESLLFGNFYQAFRFNPLLFILLPFGAVLLIDWSITRRNVSHNRKALVDRVPEWVWIGLIVIAVLYGILRNLAPFSFLAPTDI